MFPESGLICNRLIGKSRLVHQKQFLQAAHPTPLASLANYSFSVCTRQERVCRRLLGSLCNIDGHVSACVIFLRFYCVGGGHYLPSSRINDGICDCCDGSDEWKELTVRADVLQKHNFDIKYVVCGNSC